MTLTEHAGMATLEERKRALDAEHQRLMREYGLLGTVKESGNITPFWIYDDGGRAAAGFKGEAGDCVTRAFVIAQYGPNPTGEAYKLVYEDLSRLLRGWAWEGRNSAEKRPYREGRKPLTPRDGMPKSVIRTYGEQIGWVWTPTMKIGSGTMVHLRPDELPSGNLVVSVSRHLAAVVDGVLYDTHDASISRHEDDEAKAIGRRAVYGYWQPH